MHLSNERQQLKAALEETEACLTIEQLEGLLEAPRDAGVDSHVAACPRCSTELSLLREFHATARPEEETDVAWIARELDKRSPEIFGPVESLRRSQTVSQLPWWKQIFSPGYVTAASWAVAAVLLVVGAGLYLRRPQEPSLPTGVGTGTQVMRSASLELLQPAGDLQQAPQELRWKPAPGAARYEIRAMEVDRSEIWKGMTKETALTPPAELRAFFQPGKTLLWQVRAYDESGSQIATSEIQRFRIEIVR